MKDETIPDLEPSQMAYTAGYSAALGDAVAAVFSCLAWEDEQLDADGHPRLYLWQDHALAAINKLRGQP